MKPKKIYNIVFYKSFNEDEEVKKACIFYTDGSVETVSYEKGIDACEEVVKSYNITSKDMLRGMIQNHEIIHVTSAKEFATNFRNYIAPRNIQEEQADESKLEDQKVYRKTARNSGETMDKSRAVSPIIGQRENTPTMNNDLTEESDGDSEEEVASIIPEYTTINRENQSHIDDEFDEEEPTITTDSMMDGERSAEEDEEDPIVIPYEGYPSSPKAASETSKDGNTASESESTDADSSEDYDDALDLDLDEDDEDMDFVDDEIEDDDLNDDLDDERVDEFDEEFDDSIDDEIEDEEDLTSDKEEEKTEEKEQKGIIGFIKRQVEKIKKSKLVKKITAFALAIAIGLGLYSCASRKTKEGVMENSNLGNAIVDTTENPTETYEEAVSNLLTSNAAIAQDATDLNKNDNAYYNDYSFAALLQVTHNEPQKTAMTNLGNTIEVFNQDFALAHTEEGKDIRAALSFDEIVALQQAYNEYSKEDIRAYFNGAEMRASEMSRAYKDASLQLMGSYVIETRQDQVDMSGLIESEEGKEFYHKYHEMFLAMKEATGEEQLALVNEFYQAVREDFPITQEVRTEGIAHADDYASIEAYKLSVTPMIAAAEMMYQNLAVDYTLDDMEVDFLNDIGLCNYADETFERIETITLTSNTDIINPLYEQYRSAVIKMMTDAGYYVIDDEHRELSKLDAFQKAVNGHFDVVGEGEWVYNGGYTETTTTTTETNTWTEETVDTWEEEEVIEAEIPEEEKARIDEEIEAENEEERIRAEEAAEEERKRLQEEADKEAETIYEEIREEEEDLQERIEDANEQIDKNHDDNPANDKPVNESDFGNHGVDFDDEHSDDSGNLDDSVENITTDPTGDQSNEAFPDPNETGRAFDAKAFDGENYTSVEETPAENIEYEDSKEEYTESAAESEDVGYVEYVGDDAYIEYPSDYKEFDAYGNEIITYEEPVTESYEAAVEEYIDGLAEGSYIEEDPYEYTK